MAQVRGQGMIAAVQLMRDKDSKTFFEPKTKIAGQVTAECYKQGLIARPLPSVDSVAFSPPLITSKDQANQIVDIFEASLRKVMTQHL